MSRRLWFPEKPPVILPRPITEEEIMRSLAFVLPFLLLASPALAQDPAPSDPTVAAVSTDPGHRYFRLGFRAFGLVDHDGEDAAKMPVGAGMSIPLTLNFHKGLGMRLAFVGGHIQSIEYTVAWNSVKDDASTLEEHQFEGEDNRLIYYGGTVGFSYEITIPSEPFFQIFQPFLSVGAAILVVRTHPDVPVAHDILIQNEYYDGPEAKSFDPWSLQVLGGLDLSWGFHINASKTFRFPFEFGYRLVPVPNSVLDWGTEGYDYQHLQYTFNTFNFGGGLEWLF